MSLKPVFNISTNKNNSNTISPFWTKGVARNSNIKNILKICFKFFKIFILIFFVTMGLWGCIQTSADTFVKSSTSLGQGMEFGFEYGSTGNYLYDVSTSNGQTGYFTFTSWNFNYGPFYGIFIYPIALLCTSLMWATNGAWGDLNALFAILVILVLIRISTLLITIRSTIQTEKMSEVQGKIAEINAKYKDMKDMVSMQRKSQETRAIYKKYHIKPFAPFEQAMITLPIYTIIFRIINIVRPLKAVNLFNIWNFASSPTTEIFTNLGNGGWTYIFFLLIIIPVQLVSMYLPRKWAKHRSRNASAISNRGLKKQKSNTIIQLVVSGIMVAFVVFSPTGVGVYYLLSSLWSIGQAYLLHTMIVHNRKVHGSLEKKLEALGLE